MENSYKLIEIKTAGPAFEQYKPLVLATWLRGLKHGDEFFTYVESQAYFSVYSKVILALLKRENCRARLAVIADEPDTVIGWSVFEGKVLHFIFVRRGGKGDEGGRRQGIGTSLFPEGAEIFTHLTKVGRSIWLEKYPNLKFNPF